YHCLSCPARAALIELIDRHNGINNGFIGLGVRELAYELGCGHATAQRALQELDDARLAQPTKVGAWRGKKATEWRLTFRLCNKTGELPINSWEQRKPYREFQTGNAIVPNQKHRNGLRSKLETHQAKKPINGSGLSFKLDTHVQMSRQDADTERTAK